MSYRILDLDIRAPIRAVSLEPRETGIAIVARLDGRLVGFLMQQCAGPKVVSAAAITTGLQTERVQLADSLASQRRRICARDTPGHGPGLVTRGAVQP